MIIIDLPGYYSAIEQGYTLSTFTNDLESARYNKGELFLTVKREKGYDYLRADLWGCVDDIEILVRILKFPHAHMDRVEKELLLAINAVDSAVHLI